MPAEQMPAVQMHVSKWIGRPSLRLLILTDSQRSTLRKSAARRTSDDER